MEHVPPKLWPESKVDMVVLKKIKDLLIEGKWEDKCWKNQNNRF